jgi:UDP-3-O-acyl N-acetylglucosamine deacetylase
MATAPCLRSQQTLRRPVQIAGVGYWSGQSVTLECHPAPAEAGVVLVRTDGPSPVRLRLAISNRSDSPARTNLRVGDFRVEMVEHLASSLAGLGIDCCEVRLNARELPGLDGSSSAYVEAFDEAGLEDLGAALRPIVVREPVRVEEGNAWIEATPPVFAGLSVDYTLEHAHPHIGTQRVALDVTPQAYREQLAAARTFVTADEAAKLLEAGLGRHVTRAELLVFGDDGLEENVLRWPDECARHKALDLVGDLALAGRPVHAVVCACRSGHRLNARLVNSLLAHDRAGGDATSRGNRR